MSSTGSSKRSSKPRLVAACFAAGAVAFGTTSFLYSAAPRTGDADVVSMQRRALLPAAALGVVTAMQGTEEASAAMQGTWKDVNGRLTFSAGGKALYSFQLPKDNSFFKSDPEQVERAGKDPTQVAVYERKDGAVIEVGPLPKTKDFMKKTKQALIKPFKGQKVVKLEDGPTGGQLEFIEYPQATIRGGPAAGRDRLNHVWFTSLKDAEGNGVLMFIEAAKDSVGIRAGEDEKDEPKLKAIINSLKLEA